MIRFIIERHEVDHNNDINRKDYQTIDFKLQELERILNKGGSGENGFECYRVIGVEIVEEN